MAVSTSKLVGPYELGRLLGEGTFGKVRVAKHLTSGESFAMKIIDKKGLSQDHIRRLKQEVAILKAVKHPCVVDIKEVLSTVDKIYLVLQLVNGGEVWQPGQKLEESTVRVQFQRLVDGLHWCHNHGICHRDLKPDNLLLNDDGQLLISDFGLSALPDPKGGELLFTLCGSPNYVAPEVLRENGYDGKAADIWSCGVILFALITGHLPFEDVKLHRLTQKIMNVEYRIPPTCSADIKDLLKKILTADPSKRISLDNMRKHRWFRKDYVAVDGTEHLSLTSSLLLKPEDAFTEVTAEESITTTNAELNGAGAWACASLNAFDLINLSYTIKLDNLLNTNDNPIDVLGQQHHNVKPIQFTSVIHGELLLSRTAEAAKAYGCEVFLHRQNPPRLKLMLEPRHDVHGHHGVNLIAQAETYELTPKLFMLEVIFGAGQLETFDDLCNFFRTEMGLFLQ